MLSRSVRRALLDPRWHIPPPFLLPWAASLSTAAQSSTSPTPIPPPPVTPRISRSSKEPSAPSTVAAPTSKQPTQAFAQTLPTSHSPAPSQQPLNLSPSVRSLLPQLAAQAPHYITAHIHGRPYLVTIGDTVKLPFYMHGVSPGDVLRLNCAINMGSRDYTLKAAAASPTPQSPTMDSRNVFGSEAGPTVTEAYVGDSSGDASAASEISAAAAAPHFIPNIAQGKHAYLDDRLFMCRAVVLGADSEPLRIKEKTKRRQRHIRRIKSKHRFTVLRIKELRVRDLNELEALARGEQELE